MTLFSRTDTSIFGRWWWTVDRWLLAAILLLYALGIVMSLASSPAVAQRLDVDSFFFVRRQLMFIVPSLGLLIGFSLMSAVTVRRIAAVIFVVGIVCLVAVLFVGREGKASVSGSQCVPSPRQMPPPTVPTKIRLALNGCAAIDVIAPAVGLSGSVLVTPPGPSSGQTGNPFLA